MTMAEPFLADLSLRVNGTDHSVLVDTRTSLLDLLREQLQLTGSKKGCDHGQCGACTVLIDGRRANACLALAVAHDGAEIVTVEGLSENGEPHPLQRAFVEHDAFQCGYCTPGQLCSAAGMLAEVQAGWPSSVTGEQARLTPEEVRERMNGNICRCGAYPNLVRAIRFRGPTTAACASARRCATASSRHTHWCVSATRCCPGRCCRARPDSCATSAAQPRHHGREPVAANPLRLLPGHHQAL